MPKYQFNLAEALADSGKKEEAAAVLKAALVLAPNWAATARCAGLAGCATDADPRQRAPMEAPFLARQAVQASAEPTPEMLDTLAAAYAVLGRFPDAVITAEKAAQLAAAAKNPALEQQIQARLARYKGKQAYVQ